MTGLGRGAAIGVLLWAGSAGADLSFINPGPLARPHQGLSGDTNCTQCHAAGNGLSQEKCLECHTELKPEINGGRGYHGRISAAQRECETCHHEHQGADYEMVDWGDKGMNAFAHAKTGWPLNGKHQQVECLKCHEHRLILEPAILTLLKKYPNQKTFLGDSAQCKGCHFDEHRGQLATKCESCHNEAGWKKAVGFNHDKTEYPLKGKHQKVPCEQCHSTEKDTETPSEVFPTPVSRSFAKYAEIPHKSCLDCHADPHKGEFGPRCENCHVVEGWMIIHNGPKERAFHEKTKFPLRGAHINTDCGACHGPFPGVAAKFKGLKFESCSDCHPDAHESQLLKLAKEAKPPGCDRCHTVDSFRPAHFETKDHDATAYPLDGAHAAVACDACHRPDPRMLARVLPTVRSLLKRERRPELFSQVKFSLPGPNDRCETCHEDFHQGQFKKDGKATPCASCHQVVSWHKLLFNHDKDSRYPLVGKHATTPCASCHPPVIVQARAEVKYKPLDLTCAACHADVHLGQLADGNPPRNHCERCHTPDDWKKLLFVHAPPFTDYLLDGQHQKVPCTGCHQEVEVARGVKAARYKRLPRECEGCHSDFHKGAFEGFQP